MLFGNINYKVEPLMCVQSQLRTNWETINFLIQQRCSEKEQYRNKKIEKRRSTTFINLLKKNYIITKEIHSSSLTIKQNSNVHKNGNCTILISDVIHSKDHPC